MHCLVKYAYFFLLFWGVNILYLVIRMLMMCLQVSVSVIDQPEEHCDLVPNSVCHHKTKLVPRLRPEPECVLVPQQVCDIKHVNTRVERVPYTTLWCQGDDDIETGSDSLAQPSI